MRIPIVDGNDTELGFKERADIQKGDVYRVSALWLTNSKGEVLVARRAFTKSNSPGKWGPAVAGTVEEGETYESNIIKESFEEIGLSLDSTKLTKGPKLLIGGRFFDQWFLYETEMGAASFVLRRDEVEEVRWVPREELRSWYERTPGDFLDNAPDWLPVLLG